MERRPGYDSPYGGNGAGKSSVNMFRGGYPIHRPDPDQLINEKFTQIYTAPLAATRNFPITFAQSGDIVYPEFAYPNRGWIISPGQSALIAALVPIGIIVLAQIRIRSFWDTNNAIIGVLYSLILGTLFQVVIKQLIGGFRPTSSRSASPMCPARLPITRRGSTALAFIRLCTQLTCAPIPTSRR